MFLSLSLVETESFYLKKTCDYFHIEYQAHLSEFDEQSKMWVFKD